MVPASRPQPISTHAPPLPGRVLMNQDWCDLTFVHWAVDPDRVAPLLPPGVVPDVLDGVTYLGLVPFRMSGAGPGARGRVPYVGDFLETNLRFYSLDRSGRRGVVFLSLDCERLVVTAGARVGFGVRYRWAAMSHRVTPAAAGARHRYTSSVRRRGAPADLDLEVEVGPAKEATGLDAFLSARWGLHTTIAGRSCYVPNQHEPWPLQTARVTRLEGTLLAEAGFADLADREPDQVAFSAGVHTEFGFPQRLGRSAGAGQ